MTKKEIAEKHGFINGMSLYSNIETIEQKLHEAMQEYAKQQLAIQHVSNQSEQLKAFADYAQKRMWEDGDKDLSEFVEEFESL